MSITFSAALTPASRAALLRGARRSTELRAKLSDALEQGLDETKGHLQSQLLRGGRPGDQARVGGLPLAARSGALLQSIISRLDSPGSPGSLSGIVGSEGGAGRYARVHLGDEDTEILPRKAKHLWIPVGDNLTRSGLMRMSPRAAIETGRLRTFRAKSGQLLAFLDDEEGGIVKRGKHKGRRRGKIMFVLKDRVRLRGTNALAIAVQQRRERIRSLLQNALTPGSSAPGSQGGAL